MLLYNWHRYFYIFIIFIIFIITRRAFMAWRGCHVKVTLWPKFRWKLSHRAKTDQNWAANFFGTLRLRVASLQAWHPLPQARVHWLCHEKPMGYKMYFCKNVDILAIFTELKALFWGAEMIAQFAKNLVILR